MGIPQEVVDVQQPATFISTKLVMGRDLPRRDSSPRRGTSRRALRLAARHHDQAAHRDVQIDMGACLRPATSDASGSGFLGAPPSSHNTQRPLQSFTPATATTAAPLAAAVPAPAFYTAPAAANAVGSTAVANTGVGALSTGPSASDVASGSATALQLSTINSARLSDAEGLLFAPARDDPGGHTLSLTLDDGASDASGSSSSASVPSGLPKDLMASSSSDDVTDGDAEMDLLADSDDQSAAVTSRLRRADPLTMPISYVEHLYGYLSLRGQAHNTEEMYAANGAGFNISSPIRMPPASYIRYKISPIVYAAWMLPKHATSAKETTSGASVGVEYILPSDHILRDLQFEGTLANFKAADQRSSIERQLHPEFVDSPLFQDRAASLLCGQSVPRFVLHGLELCAGDQIHVELANGHVVRDALISGSSFASRRSGLKRDGGRHAGDFVVECRLTDGTSASLVAHHWHSTTLSPLSWISKPETVHDVDSVHKSAVRVVPA